MPWPSLWTDVHSRFAFDKYFILLRWLYVWLFFVSFRSYAADLVPVGANVVLLLQFYACYLYVCMWKTVEFMSLLDCYCFD